MYLVWEGRGTDSTRELQSKQNRTKVIIIKQKRMSKQVVPISTFDGSGEPPMQMQNGNTTDHAQKHVYSRFLKKRPPDLYGQRHAIETDKCVNDSLRLLEKELQKIPNVKRSGLEQASIICPEIYESKEHRLLFLRCEQFNADVSVHIFI